MLPSKLRALGVVPPFHPSPVPVHKALLQEGAPRVHVLNLLRCNVFTLGKLCARDEGSGGRSRNMSQPHIYVVSHMTTGSHTFMLCPNMTTGSHTP